MQWPLFFVRLCIYSSKGARTSADSHKGTAQRVITVLVEAIGVICKANEPDYVSPAVAIYMNTFEPALKF